MSEEQENVENLLKTLQEEAKDVVTKQKHKTRLDKDRFRTTNYVHNTNLKLQGNVSQRKPMEPYKVNAVRNRLPTAEFIQPYKNSSSITLGTSGKNYYKSINQQCFKDPRGLYKMTSNQDINSRHNKIAKKDVFEKI